MSESTNQTAAAPEWGHWDWLGLTVFGAATVTAFAWLMTLGRGLTFFYDEWDFVSAGASGSYWHQVIQPHNGHPSMVPYTIYDILLNTVGLRSYWPYQVVLVVFDVGCGLLVFVLLRRKVHPLGAAAAGSVLILLGPAWQDLLWPFQIGFIGSVAGGLGALVLLDRDGRRTDVGALGCLVFAIASSGVGLVFVAGVGVELLWRRRDWLRLWIPLVPLALFVTWYKTMGDSQVSTISLSSMAHTAAQGTTQTIGAVVGRGTTAGTVLGIVLGVLCLIGFVRSPRRAGRLAMAITGLSSFWILTDVARGASVSSPSRYLYPAAALVLIAMGELPSLVVVTETRHRAASKTSSARVVSGVLAAGVVAYAGLAVWWNAASLVGGADGLRAVSSEVRAELGAVLLAGHALPATYQPDKTFMPQVRVGMFLRAVKAFGSPADSLHAIDQMPPMALSSIDAMLLRGRSMQVTLANPSRLGNTGACKTYPVGGSASVTIALPANGAFVTASSATSLAVRAAALSTAFPTQPQGIVAPGSTSLVRWTVRPNRITWRIRLSALLATSGPSSATVCPVS